jgi:hypothetical protein
LQDLQPLFLPAWIFEFFRIRDFHDRTLQSPQSNRRGVAGAHHLGVAREEKPARDGWNGESEWFIWCPAATPTLSGACNFR